MEIPTRPGFVEYLLLCLVQKSAQNYTPDLYENNLPGLSNDLKMDVSDIDNREIVEALKRLQPQKYLNIGKYVDGQHLEYPTRTSEAGLDEEEVFYKGRIALWRTEFTEPRLQELAVLFPPPAARQMTRRSIMDFRH